MAATATRGGKVAPSIIRSETFLFALVVLALGVVVPYYTRPGGSTLSSYQNTTSVPVVAPVASEPSPIIIQPRVPLQQQPPIQQPPLQYVAPANPPLSNPPRSSVSQPSSNPQAPITYILPLLISATNAVFRFTTRVPVYTYVIVQTTVIHPLGYPLSILWWILRPLTLLLEIIYILFIRTPFSIVSWFVTEAIYPLYVFFGVAALLGGGVGYAASHIPKALNAGIAQIRGSRAPRALTKPDAVAKKIRVRPIKKRDYGGNDALSSFWKEEEFVKAEEEYADAWKRARGYDR